MNAIDMLKETGDGTTEQTQSQIKRLIRQRFGIQVARQLGQHANKQTNKQTLELPQGGDTIWLRRGKEKQVITHLLEG